MSYSTDPVTLDVNKYLKPPMSKTTQVLDKKPHLVVSKKAIELNEVKVVDINMQTGKVVNTKRNIRQNAIMPLHTALKKFRKSIDIVKEMRKDDPRLKKERSTIILNADLGTKFLLLKQVMRTASQSEFTTFNLVVNRPQ